MARTINSIKESLLETKATLSALDGLTSNSQVSIFNQVFHVTAVNISILEQLIEAFISDLDTNEEAVGTAPWIRAKVLEFQYDSVDAQYVELDTTTFEIGYPQLRTDLQIITRCSVKEGGNLIVHAKVAKSDPPEPLAGAEVTALENYLDVIMPAGIQINVVSSLPDKLYIEGVVYNQGQYSSVIRANVETALTEYMDSLSSAENFNGTVRVSEIIDAIQAVEGVTDVRISEIGIRGTGIAFASRTILYKLSSGINNLEYETVSGYVVEEDTALSTFTDTIDFESV